MEGFTLPYLWKLLYYEKTPYFEHTHTFQNYFIYFLVLHPANKTGFEWLGGGIDLDGWRSWLKSWCGIFRRILTLQ